MMLEHSEQEVDRIYYFFCVKTESNTESDSFSRIALSI